MLTLDNNRSPSPVDDLFHQNVPPLISRFCGLPDVFVTKVSEDVRHQILEFEPREIIQDCHFGDIQNILLNY
ncbi:hypothetical protein C487_19728 [Natrinema pallidum DSM 3751]|uniref:Uncharacterized protein n=1 Tax=Natrinema pallidum DSM 3751 TaxID=1227495 RepID=L9YEW7_9EURY|nr:hypothetical protein C487_19728 [Natrinema pallidum DSM 3751]